MQVGWKIVCASGAVSRVESRFAELCEGENIPVTQQPQIAPYWKAEGLCEVTWEHSAPQALLDRLIPFISRIGGTEQINQFHQGEFVEYSACVSLAEIISDERKAFVVCFVNMKEKKL